MSAYIQVKPGNDAELNDPAACHIDSECFRLASTALFDRHPASPAASLLLATRSRACDRCTACLHSSLLPGLELPQT